MRGSILLKQALLIDSDGIRQGGLLIRDGLIHQVGETGATAERVVDCGGRALMPAFVDLHAHFRDPGLTHKEDIHSGCRAAVGGGYTAVHLMPNTKPVCSTPDIVRYVRDRAAELDLCDVYQAVSITRDFDGQSLDHLDHLEESVGWITDDGYGVQDTGVTLRAMERAKAAGIGVMLHEEDNALSAVDSYLAEELMTFRDVELACLTGCKTHFCHVSTIRAMDYILAGKARGGDITCEVMPHHLYFSDENPGRVNPPLRGEALRRYLIDCVKAGRVDAIATDHAPHTPRDKEQGANGFVGLDLAFATCNTALVRGGHIGLPQLSRLMSAAPAGLLGLDKGLLRPGMAGDVVLVDPDAHYTVDESHIRSKSKNTPMLGERVYGEVLMTVKGGNVVYEKAH